MTEEYILSYSVNGSPFIKTCGNLFLAEKEYEMLSKSDTPEVKTDYKHIIKVTKFYDTIK